MRPRPLSRSLRPRIESLEGRALLSTLASFTLIDADTDQPIAGYEALADGATLNLATLPTRNLNIRADTVPAAVGSVRFAYDGNAAYSTESTAPYALAGDVNGNYNPWTPAPGTHTLTATPYSGAGATGTAGTARSITFTVTDNASALPAVSIGDAAVAEGNSGAATASFAVTLSAASSQPVTVAYATANGTAAAPGDYAAAGGTLTFAVGETSKTIAVAVAGDVLDEADETFVVNLSAPTNATLGDAQGQATITDDDPAAGQAPFGGSPAAVPATIQAEDFDTGGEGVAYHDTTGGNLGGAYRPAESVDLEATTDAGGGYNVGYALAGEWLEYTVSVPAAGAYALEARVASAGAGGAFHVEFDGVDETGPLAVPDTGGWQSWQTVQKTGLSLAAGTQVMRVAFDAAGGARGFVGNLNWLRLTATATDPPPPPRPPVVSGALAAFQALTLSFAGPPSSEAATAPNPFLDYRMQVTFTGPAGQAYSVPGFFDGDGHGGGTGDVWRARFTPDQAGPWSYAVSFRGGADVAVDLSPTAGTATSIDGTRGTLTVGGVDATAPGFLSKGRLEYAGAHYLKFRDGTYWIKGGADSPENFLSYGGFDDTPNAKLTYANHVQDWRAGDPDWGGGKGKAIIGALNYLASHGVNSIYLLPMNIGGDGQDTWPFVGPINAGGSSSNDNLHYDISKLAQWEVVFAHAQRLGIHLHLVLNEAEAPNKNELDGATLGRERQLFYRELVARFGHHNAITWNVSEEYDVLLDLGPDRVKQFAGYIQSVDPYDHPITVHNWAAPTTSWAPFLGDGRFSVTSFQEGGGTAGNGALVEEWRQRSAASGRPLPINLDELRATTTANMVQQRKEIIWPTYLSGGAGLEHYMGELDQSLNDFRPFANAWDWTWYARRFVQDNLRFWEMQPEDGLLTGEVGVGQVFARRGSAYALYLPAGGGGTLDLSGAAGQFSVRWYNPRTGQFEGATQYVTGGGAVSIPAPPSAAAEDWAVLITSV